MPAIGNAIGIPFRRGGISWSSYWATRTPSNLRVAASEIATSAILTWDDAVSAAEGVRIYMSSDNITFTELTTVNYGVGTYTATGLTQDTTYYFYLKAYSGINEGTTSNKDSATILKYRGITTLGSSAEEYNSGKGIRKKTSATDAWVTSSVGGAIFSDTLSHGEYFIVKIDNPSHAVYIFLDPTNVDTASSLLADFAVYTGYGLTPNVSFEQANTAIGGTVGISTGDLLRIRYIGAFMYLDQSTDNGATWTNIKVSTNATSGVYKIGMTAYSKGGGYSEIYKYTPKHTGYLTDDDVWLFAFIGESNSGGYAVNADLTAGELAARSAVQIWNNTTNTYQDLDIGTNNLISHDGLVDNATHGWENGLASEVEAAILPNPVYLAKCGQGEV